MFDSECIARIEEQLSIKLPVAYARELSNYPFATNSPRYHDPFWGDAEAIVENNLLLRKGFGSCNWPEDYLAIGNDDVGNIYFIQSDNDNSPVFCA